MRLVVAAAATLVGLLPAGADAALYIFDLTGSREASFTLDSSHPDFASAYQTQFRNVAGTFGGTPGVASAVSFGAIFFISALDIANTPLGFAQFDGPQLFTGLTSAPVFKTGTFALSGFVSGNSTLTIAAVPEPAGWALIIAGFGLIGLTARRRRALAA